ncbi:MAG: ABC transporter substrate-binding protein [Dehalococcoidia bacterium]|nr:ABC transporter substrate-binding protein [Dehalococcoidia bacterium]
MRRSPKRPLAMAALALVAIMVVVAACAPAATPTPTPTKAPPPPPTATAAPAKVVATAPAEKPVEKPAATPTTAPVAKPTGKAIKVCYLTPLTGPLASIGLPQSIAVKMAQEDINNTGGINGSPLEVLTKDSPFDAKQAVTLVRECAEKDQVVALFGPYSSGEFDVAAPLGKDLTMPVIGASTTKVGGALSGRPWSFRMTITDDLSTDAGVGAFAKVYPNAKKIVIIGDVKEAVTEPVVKVHYPPAFKKYGLESLGLVEFTRGMTDFGAVVTKVKEMKPEGIAIAALPGEWALIAKELANQGVKVPVVSSPHPWPGNTVFQVKDVVEGWIVGAFFQEDLPGAEVQAWVKRFRATGEADPKIPKPVYASVDPQMYDAIMYGAKVMREGKVTGDTPFQQVRVLLRDGYNAMKDYKGIVRTYTMNQDGDAVGPVYPVVAKNGRWELIK